jgi:Zn-dependent peptidase ImmA (M78 family)
MESAIDTWLMKTTGHRFASAAIDSMVTIKLGSALRHIPVDPIQVAESLGCRVKLESVPAASIEITNRDRVIHIPASESFIEQRFSVAHEIAHLFFFVEDAEGIKPVFRKNIDNFDQKLKHKHKERLETVCDMVARHILVPTAQLEGRLASEPRFEDLFTLAKEFEVSPRTIFIRLLESKKLPKYPGRVLLRFGANEFTGKDEAWRIAARAMPPSVPQQFFWPNRSLSHLGIKLPKPSKNKIASCDLRFDIKLGSQDWQLQLEMVAEQPEWALAYAILIKDEASLFGK